ncbi:unnamed protein product, partial [Polarella glacialis]
AQLETNNSDLRVTPNQRSSSTSRLRQSCHENPFLNMLGWLSKATVYNLLEQTAGLIKMRGNKNNTKNNNRNNHSTNNTSTNNTSTNNNSNNSLLLAIASSLRD